MIIDSADFFWGYGILVLACPVIAVIEFFRHRRLFARLGIGAGCSLVLIGIATIGLREPLIYAFARGQPLSFAQFDHRVTFLPHFHSIEASGFAVLAGVIFISLGLFCSLRCMAKSLLEDQKYRQTSGPAKFKYTTASGLWHVNASTNSIQQALERSEDRFTQLVTLLPETVFELSLEGRIIYTNPAGFKMLQYSEEDLGKGLNIRDYFAPADWPRARINFNCIVQGQTLGPNEYTLRRKDGRLISAIISSRPIFCGKKVSGVLGAIFDNSERKRTERELKASQSMLRDVLNTIPVRVFWKDRDSCFLGCNIQFARDAGFDSPEQIIGKKDSDIVSEETAARYRVDDLSVLETRVPKLNYVEKHIDRNGKEHKWLRSSKIPLLDNDSNLYGILGCYEDVTESRLLSQELEYLASHDPLTALFNRREFERRLARVLETAQNENSCHALCYLDLDQFKVVNDTCGHSAGDELLNQLGAVLQNQIRKLDTLARLGGDEFGILMEYCSLDHAEIVANKLRSAVAEFRFNWEGRSFSVGASIGVVPIDASTGIMTELLVKADSACYAAKDGGRNRIHVYSEDDLELSRRHGEMQWVSKIHEALRDDRFVLFAQPIVPLNAKNQGKHCEILTRLLTEDGQTILPGAFFPAAERYNISPRLDRWVVENTLNWMGSNPTRLKGLAMCSINLSGHSLNDEVFQNFVSSALQKQNIPPGKVCFEITETAAISNLSRAIRFIAGLKEQGCRFALDDFGSGLSSFAYLKSLPVDYLKIDGMFVTDILEDPIDFAMVRSINEIGQLMGKETIAEFVESDAIREKLCGIGVNYIQGYAAGVPVPLDELECSSVD